MRLFVESTKRTPVVAFQLAFPGGTVLDPPGREGLTRVVMETLRRGTKSKTRKEIDQALDQIGASLNVGCSRDAVYISGLCLRRHFETYKDIVFDLLAEPSFSDEERLRVIDEAIADIGDIQDDDGSLVARHFRTVIAKGHSYGRTSLGTESTLGSIAKDADLRHHFATLTGSSEPILGIAGDIENSLAKNFAERIDQIFATDFSTAETPATARTAQTIDLPPLDSRSLLLVDKPFRSQSHILMGHVAPRYGTEDFAQTLVAETIFGGMFSSRLTQEVRVENGWSYNASSHLGRARRPLWMLLDFAPNKNDTGVALAHVLDMFERFIDKGISDQELAMAKTYLAGGLAFSRETPRQRMHSFVQLACCDLPADYPSTLLASIEKFTSSQVNNTLKRCFVAKNLGIALVTTEKEVRDQIAEVDIDRYRAVDWESDPTW